MTEQEAIETLKRNYPKTCKMVNGRLQGGFNDLECELGQAVTMGISALEELQQYREIGTVEECREAREKKKPKTPSIEGDGCADDGQILYDTWICPGCGKRYEIDYDDYRYCPECGQHIKRMRKDWSEKKNEKNLYQRKDNGNHRLHGTVSGSRGTTKESGVYRI